MEAGTASSGLWRHVAGLDDGAEESAQEEEHMRTAA